MIEWKIGRKESKYYHGDDHCVDIWKFYLISFSEIKCSLDGENLPAISYGEHTRAALCGLSAELSRS